MRIQDVELHVNLLEALLWQHNNAHRLTALIAKKQQWYNSNLQTFWDDWRRDVFDLRTANSFGVKVWSIILDLPINIVTAPTDPIFNNFGFGPLRSNFGHGTFGREGSGYINVSLEDARVTLRLRYFKLICRPTIPEINAFLDRLFRPRGIRAYVVDTLDMVYNYVFEGAPNNDLVDMLVKFDVLPRPAAVGVFVSTGPVIDHRPFGFGQYNSNFQNGNFAE